MKKILFILPLVLAIAMIFSYKQSGQNVMAENHAKQAITIDIKGINKSDIRESKADQESLTTKKTPEGRPRILFMLSNDKGLPGWPPSLLWTNTGQSGC
jgi:hypothetical protein